MKQGRASVEGSDRKREPISHAVSETFASQIGQALSKPGRDMYEGRGYKAPMTGETTHHCGSQGKHK